MRAKLTLRAAAVIAGLIAVSGVLLTACVQPSPHSPLRVTVVPSKTEVRVSEPFTLALRVENISQTDQTIRVMTCSWQDEWKSSN